MISADKLFGRMAALYADGPKSVQFGQADFSGPAFAAFDLASILVSFEDIRLRQEKTGLVWVIRLRKEKTGWSEFLISDKRTQVGLSNPSWTKEDRFGLSNLS